MSEALCLWVDHIETPLGLLALVADEDCRLRAVGWTEGHARMEQHLHDYSSGRSIAVTSTSNPGGLSVALRAYFAGDSSAIDGLPVRTGGTEFQQMVWAALREIPCGETRSYAELARRIGRPNAARAVGLANGANPVAVVMPCHRVVGADGSLTGYAGGIERKRWLLAHERRSEIAVNKR